MENPPVVSRGSLLRHTDSVTHQQDSDDDDRSDRKVGSYDLTRWRTKTGQRLARRHHALADRLGGHGALVASLAIGGSIAVAASFGASLIYDAVTSRNGIEALDGPALALGKKLRSPAVNAAAAGIARVFGPVGMPILALGAAGVLAAREQRATPVTLMTAAGLGSLAMTIAGKDIIHRNRPPRRDAIPPYEKSPSFPSGHTLNATTVLGTAVYLLALQNKKTAPQAALITGAAGTAMTVGLSRVLLGAHWFTDVAVGWTTGAGWLSLIITSHRLYLTSQDHASEQNRPAES
jgi:undecaprenyl-diphosphatase